MCVLYGEIGRHSRHRDLMLMYQHWRLALTAERDRATD